MASYVASKPTRASACGKLFQATTSGEPVRWANAFIVKNGAHIFLFNEKGDLVISESHSERLRGTWPGAFAGADKYCSRARCGLVDPAFANRHMYARNDKEIICVDLGLKK